MPPAPVTRRRAHGRRGGLSHSPACAKSRSYCSLAARRRRWPRRHRLAMGAAAGQLWRRVIDMLGTMWRDDARRIVEAVSTDGAWDGDRYTANCPLHSDWDRSFHLRSRHTGVAMPFRLRRRRSGGTRRSSLVLRHRGGVRAHAVDLRHGSRGAAALPVSRTAKAPSAFEVVRSRRRGSTAACGRLGAGGISPAAVRACCTGYRGDPRRGG